MTNLLSNLTKIFILVTIILSIIQVIVANRTVQSGLMLNQITVESENIKNESKSESMNESKNPLKWIKMSQKNSFINIYMI